MSAPRLSGFARVGVAGAVILAFTSVVVGVRTSVGIPLFVAACVCLAVSGLFTSSEVRHAMDAVEAHFPGRLDSYSVVRWNPLWTRNEDRLRHAMADPVVQAVESLRPQLGRAVDAMRVGLVVWALWFVLIIIMSFS
ncbi:MAG: hypothetical protein JXR33_10545 [Coriobacteriia bacterium]|nr:hypothetical protein [Coriobacteriia bacterium]